MADLKFQKLTPTDDVDLKGYEDGFKFIFDNKDICNVAISGPYSSGKSSVLETYEKKHGEKKFIHIFLAHFSEAEENRRLYKDDGNNKNMPQTGNKAPTGTEFNKVDVGNSDIKKYAENTIEGKILNQLIQQIPADDIPHTHFHVKREVEKHKYQYITLGIAFILVAILFFVYGSEWNAWVSSIRLNGLRAIFNVTITHGFQFVFGVAAMAVFFYGIYNILLTQANKNVLKKLSIQGNEIEIFSDTEDSYFDKYLNEVLYLLEQVNVDVIVFEDIDRFNEIQVFERLREINTLANIRRTRLKKQELKFFYLLRDDIFITKDRTKFFDYIMPVVPVVDGSNSYNKLKEYLTDAGLFEKLDDFFLRELCLYIDDLRLVKNIVNEFVLFGFKLNIIELDYNKFFGLITYKNIFPKDYADLQLRKGFVFTIFNSKETFLKNRREELEADIKQLKERIDSMDLVIAENIRELDAVKDYKQKTLNRSSAEFNKWCKEDYVRLKQGIEDRQNSAKDSLQKELSNLMAKAENVDNYTIAQIIDGNPESEVFKAEAKTELGNSYSFEEIKENDYFPLLKFLLTNGYIDETYNDYLTFFYENSLTAKDKIFLRAVADRRAKDYGYHLDNIPLVLENIKPSRFRQRGILNYDLIEYLLKTDNQRRYLSPLITQLRESQNYDFIVSFFDTDRERERFVVLLDELWPEFFSIICKRSNQGLISIQKKFSLISLVKCDEKTLERVNTDEVLTSYISATPDYLNIHLGDEEAEALIAAFIILDIKFERIDIDHNDADLLEKVYVHNLYVINAGNLRMFMLLKYKAPDLNLDFSKSLTVISSQTEEPIFNYLQQEPELTLSAILDITEGQINDDEDVMMSVINNDKISLEVRNKYLLRCTTKISSLTDIRENTFRKTLMENSALVYSANNILSYYNENGWKPELVSFLNSSSEALDYKSAVNLIGAKKKQFVDDAIKSKSIDEKHFYEIAQQLGEKKQTFNFSGCQQRNVEILANEKLIAMTKANLDFIRNHYPQALRKFISSDFKTYTNVLGSQYDQSEVEEAFGWPEIQVEDKLFLLSRKNEKFTALRPDYPAEVLIEILKNHRIDNELTELYKQYDEYAPLVQNEIFSIATSKISVITSSGTDMHFTLLNRLLSSTKIPIKNRIALVQKHIKNLEIDERTTVLSSLGGDEIAHALLPQKSKTVACTTENQSILQMLLDTGIIASFDKEENTDKYRITVVRKKKEPELLD